MFRIEFLPSAARQFKKLDARSRRSIANRIDRLARNPRPAEYKLLKGRTGICRIRSGNYRILYRIEDERLTVLVIRIAIRAISYRNLTDLD